MPVFVFEGAAAVFGGGRRGRLVELLGGWATLSHRGDSYSNLTSVCAC